MIVRRARCESIHCFPMVYQLFTARRSVVAVYIPEKWYHSEVAGKEHKLEFEEKENSSSDYIGKSVKTFYGHSSNPVKYINM